jgi:hypothetical protein
MLNEIGIPFALSQFGSDRGNLTSPFHYGKR